MRISDWSSDVCSSDLVEVVARNDRLDVGRYRRELVVGKVEKVALHRRRRAHLARHRRLDRRLAHVVDEDVRLLGLLRRPRQGVGERSEEHTSELQSLMRISYAVFCLKKKNKNRTP